MKSNRCFQAREHLDADRWARYVFPHNGGSLAFASLPRHDGFIYSDAKGNSPPLKRDHFPFGKLAHCHPYGGTIEQDYLHFGSKLTRLLLPVASLFKGQC